VAAELGVATLSALDRPTPPPAQQPAAPAPRTRCGCSVPVHDRFRQPVLWLDSKRTKRLISESRDGRDEVEDGGLGQAGRQKPPEESMKYFKDRRAGEAPIGLDLHRVSLRTPRKTTSYSTDGRSFSFFFQTGGCSSAPTPIMDYAKLQGALNKVIPWPLVNGGLGSGRFAAGALAASCSEIEDGTACARARMRPIFFKVPTDTRAMKKVHGCGGSSLSD
jgi:hypothetical protein